MNIVHKIAAAAGAITLGAVGVAAAAADTPDAADAGLTRAAEHVGAELPASHDSHPGADDANDQDSDVETTDDETTDVESAGEGVGPVDNHGAEVSAVATSDDTTGREHGMAVSEVARQGHGHGPSEDHPSAP